MPSRYKSDIAPAKKADAEVKNADKENTAMAETDKGDGGDAAEDESDASSEEEDEDAEEVEEVLRVRMYRFVVASRYISMYLYRFFVSVSESDWLCWTVDVCSLFVFCVTVFVCLRVCCVYSSGTCVCCVDPRLLVYVLCVPCLCTCLSDYHEVAPY